MHDQITNEQFRDSTVNFTLSRLSKYIDDPKAKRSHGFLSGALSLCIQAPCSECTFSTVQPCSLQKSLIAARLTLFKLEKG